MKFGEELIAERVPEWADKYLDYKTGKKHIKAVADAIEREEAAFKAPVHRKSGLSRLSTRRRARTARAPESPVYQPPRASDAQSRVDPVAVALSRNDQGYNPSASSSRQTTPSPDGRTAAGLRHGVAADARPGAVGPEPSVLPRHQARGDAGDRQQDRTINALLAPFSGVRSRFFEGEMHPLNSTDPVEKAKSEFFHFLISELQKVDTFYRTKEEEAGARLQELRAQLQVMRHRRNDDILQGAQNLSEEDDQASRPLIERMKGSFTELASFGRSPKRKTIAHIVSAPILAPAVSDSQRRRDFVPKRVIEDEAVTYKDAKRKIKAALHEFYRSLDLIQSYAALNRTAFQKLNKKYDKNAGSTEKLEFMHNYVDRSNFVNSTVIEGHMKTTQDLFARYFERGNTKAALTKLRARKTKDESLSTFHNGVLVGLGLILSIQGFISALKLMFDDDVDDDLRKVVVSHLQIYGGYVLMLCMFWMFCLNCYIWTRAKINYPFIFEFDTRHTLDWRKMFGWSRPLSLVSGYPDWGNTDCYSDAASHFPPQESVLVCLFPLAALNGAVLPGRVP
ncbi:SPX domain-containing protein [Immersiella caudata]|uniref:SPX domain-containing protein n=1 Tax=Immersiella caudata TaxID=314043 RepID=A0AA39X534_9PEZI|nr:SPX domain-containing protein [Immersiella caudata]